MTTFIKSESIKHIASALAGFQSNVGKIKKEAKNPFFKSSYASLSNILETIQAPLTDAGLAFSQFPDGEHGLTTILIHTESGEYLQASFTMKPSKDDPQGIGSAITYARRYALGAVLGLNIDEDDDGNAASGNGKKEQQKAPARNTPPAKPAITAKQFDQLMERVKKGDTAAADKAIETFTMTQEQKDTLSAVYLEVAESVTA